MAFFKLENSGLSVKINSYGAELCSVIDSDTGIEYIWQAEPKIWARHAPNLFPIVGKLKAGEFIYQSNSYHLPQHGFARDSEFICIEQTNTSIIFELTASEETLQSFPFHFSLQIKYTLIENRVEIAYTVFNPDNSDLYFSIGAHPAFNCPLQSNELFADYELFFPTNSKLIINQLVHGLISKQKKEIELKDNRLRLSPDLFDNDALVMMNNQINEIHLISKKTKKGICLKSLNWPFFGVWTKKQTEQFICLEPWYGIADFESSNNVFNSKEGIIVLASEQSFNCEYEIIFY